MSAERIAAALHRIETLLERRPALAVHADVPAVARWEGGARVVSTHPDGSSVATDLPSELGGMGEGFTPGWLWRAALGSCLATRIVMSAALEGIALASVEVAAHSKSDLRGLLGMRSAGGAMPGPEPRDVQLRVRIEAPAPSHERLRALVAHSQSCCPMQAAALQALAVDVSVELLER